MTALDDVAAERRRQMEVEGWTSDHDDIHTDGEMALAAACYVMHGLKIGNWGDMHARDRLVPRLWPWDVKWWKPKDKRRALVRAAALIVAEIERMDRDRKPLVSEIQRQF